MDSVTLMIGIISCAVGVFAFISGMMQRSKSDGALENKVDNALKGIDEIKATLNEQQDISGEMRVVAAEQQQQINTLFRRVEVLEEKHRKD